MVRPIMHMGWVWLLVAACTVTASPPQRPDGVPESARWVGGSDGGVFMLIEDSPEKPGYIFQARIFDGDTGDTLYQGRLSLDLPDSPPVNSNTDIFSAWDGLR